MTWDPTYFSSPNQQVEVQVDYGAGDGVSSTFLNAADGFYVWAVDPKLLQKSPVNANVTLFLSYRHNTGSGPEDLRVPRGGSALTVIPAPATRTSVSPLAIALPVVIGVVVLGLAGFCFWSWRRHGQLPLIGALASRRRAQGYGVRKSHSQRTGAAAGLSVGTGAGAGAAGARGGKSGAGIQLTPRESWSPTQGRNVFREEIRRQDDNAR